MGVQGTATKTSVMIWLVFLAATVITAGFLFDCGLRVYAWIFGGALGAGAVLVKASAALMGVFAELVVPALECVAGA